MEILNQLFMNVIKCFTSSPIVAISGAFIWGILSVILSPCHLSSIPLAIGFINGKGAVNNQKILLLSFLFSLGILISISVIGFITGLLGRMLGDIGNAGTIFVGVVFIFIAAWLLNLIKLPFPHIIQPKMESTTSLAALILGAIFGMALGPCTFGFMMPLLAIIFQIAPTNFGFALALGLAFAMGHIAILMFAGIFTNFVQLLLKWDTKSKGTIWLKKICGILVGLSGGYLIFSALL